LLVLRLQAVSGRAGVRCGSWEKKTEGSLPQGGLEKRTPHQKRSENKLTKFFGSKEGGKRKSEGQGGEKKNHQGRYKTLGNGSRRGRAESTTFGGSNGPGQKKTEAKDLPRQQLCRTQLKAGGGATLWGEKKKKKLIRTSGRERNRASSSKKINMHSEGGIPLLGKKTPKSKKTKRLEMMKKSKKKIQGG